MMDNRVPPILKDHILNSSAEKEDKDIIAFLSFEDWRKESVKSTDWAIVACRYNSEFMTLFTFSCLVNNDNDRFEKVLEDEQWLVDSEFGYPPKYQESNEAYDDGLTLNTEDLTFTPFSFTRHFHERAPDRFELIQTFLLHYNAYWAEDITEWKSVSEDGKVTTLARHKRDRINDNETIEVDMHLLKEYLAIRNASLIRFHDHKRRTTVDISPLIKEKFINTSVSDNLCFFSIDLRTDIQYNKIKSTSRLLGKDVLKGYSKRGSINERNKTDKQYADFIIGRDDLGREIIINANPSSLSNYFKDNKTPHFLTSVFFRKEVLLKYYASPSEYEVTELRLQFLKHWSIDLDITKENLVHVYLGNLGRNLPFEEQLHWRSFNVQPIGKMSEFRFKADFLNQWPVLTVDDVPVQFFRDSFEKLQSVTNEKWEKTLFKDLNENDYHLYKSLRIPLNDGWQESTNRYWHYLK